MKTYFAPAERLNKEEIDLQVKEIKNNVFLNEMLNSLKSLIAVINLQRQIIAVNEKLVKSLGFDNVEDIFGLRPGEAIKCVYSNENEAGCGTSKMCRSCGAIRAIINSIENNTSQVELCALRILRNNKTVDVAFEVTACPLNIGNDRFITLHLRDVTNERLKNAMEKTFFHDINNLLSALIGSSELLTMQDTKDADLESRINSLSLRVSKEIEVQRALTYAYDGNYIPDISNFTIKEIIEDIFIYCDSEQLEVSTEVDNSTIIQTDHTLLLRILTNMIKNGIEASKINIKVNLRIFKKENKLVFSVWNHQPIPEDIHRRIFQEHFSTKNGNYRGLGTHSMKIFGEKILKGNVWFESSEDKGTTFFFKLP